MGIDLDKLRVQEEAAPVLDWDTPEQGNLPPQIFPGVYLLRFRMVEDLDNWMEMIEREVITGNADSKRPFVQVNYQPVVVANSQGQPLSQDDGSPIILGPQHVSNFQNAKMTIHGIAELLRSMGTRIEGSLFRVDEATGKTVLEGTLAELNDKATFTGEVIWRTYFKSTGLTVSSAPRKKKGELPWPRAASGQYELMASNPATGEKAYGYVEVARYKLPTSDAAAPASQG